MNTIQKNSESNSGTAVQTKKVENKLQSTITIEPSEPEHMQTENEEDGHEEKDEREEEDEREQQLHITDEENEQELNSIVPATTDASSSTFFYCSSKHFNIYI
jgi:hypothetical protein